MLIRELLLPEYDQEITSTRKLLECVPDDKLGWKPHEKSMSLGRLAGHIAEIPNWAARTIQTESFEIMPGRTPYVGSSRADLLQTLEKYAAEGRQAIAGASDEDFSKPWTLKFAGKTVFSLPRSAVLRSMAMSHLVHHRGQLSVYLRLLDVPIPGMYGPSADESGRLAK